MSFDYLFSIPKKPSLSEEVERISMRFQICLFFTISGNRFPRTPKRHFCAFSFSERLSETVTK